ncbi:MAG TPA: aminotransferase class I/II-fold pyridoxal phosphate-dependent enzyme [Candidatus Acidoferrales bacterium]|nr:aminotransferase class I/II-fold pyridoxal phosphate-dependent enzyme [Candidatus Acidoferrales bacterium]
MAISRRSLLAQLAGGVAGTALAPEILRGAAPWLREHTGAPIRLDRNESAYGPSAHAVAAIREAAAEAALYPAAGNELVEALGEHHRVNAKQVVLGCGSTEVLAMAAAAFLGPGKKLILGAPTLGLMRQFGAARGAEIVQVPLRKNHAHDLNATFERAKNGSGLIYICNPNNPTGTLTERKDLEEFLENVPESFHVAIDEAYHHYAGSSGAYASFLDQLSRNPRVIVVRTFSTVYGLAGLRVGYGIAQESVAEQLRNAALPSGVSRVGLAAALAALRDQQHVKRCAQQNANDRQEFMNQVNGRMLRTLDSHTNFICLNTTKPSQEIVAYFQKNGIVIAPPIPELPTYIRVTLGTPKQMAEFWRVWDPLDIHPMSM